VEYRKEYGAFAWRGAKTAALYFDKVIPANFIDLYRYDKDDPIYYDILKDLLPPSLLTAPSKTNVTGLQDVVGDYISRYLITFPNAVGLKTLSSGETLEERADRNLDGLLDSFEKLVAASQARDFAVYGETLTETEQTDRGDPCLILTDLALVDTSKISWRHLLEFRRDAQSVDKLHSLRRFVFKEYAGQSLDFISEDMAKQIEKYEEATKLWGFPLTKGLLKVALTADAATALSATVATLFGAALPVAAAAGLALTLGSATLAIAIRRREVDVAKKENPVAYLMEAKALENKKKD
jgi:hypothetical protein